MQTPQLEPLSTTDSFQFDCHARVSCFNQCCRDLNQALSPYDVVRLKNALRISSEEFIRRYAIIHVGPATGLSVASLRFADNLDRTCPFVSPAGCTVYAHRPASCRLYPLARAVQRSRSDGSLSEHYALLKEAHCHGFDEAQTRTVDRWIDDQGLEDYLKMNDALADFIALKNRLRPGPLPPEQARLARLALYDVDNLKKQAIDGLLESTPNPLPLPALEDDKGWLLWGLDWLRQVLFNL